MGVNGCYVKDFFPRFERRMGIARTEVQRAMYVRGKQEDTIFVRMSFSSGWVTILHGSGVHWRHAGMFDV